MWKSCWDCCRKHLSSAWVFLNETHLGYPDHRWLCVGELVHAENEIINDYPVFANEIREIRLVVMKSHAESFKADIFKLIRKACLLAGETTDITVAASNSKIYDAVTDNPFERAVLHDPSPAD